MKLERFLFSFMCVFIVSFSVSGAALVEVPDSSKLYRLREVGVYTEKSGFSVVSPVSAQSLSGDRLEKMSLLTVADAVRLFSGVQLKDYGGIGGLKTINVRSMGSAHTSLFYDGILIGNAQNGEIDLGKFSLDNINEIQLFNGQKPDIFQPARALFSSGSLYLNTKRTKPIDSKRYEISVGAKTGSFGLINPSLRWQYWFSNDLSISSHVEYLHADGNYKYRYDEGDISTIMKRGNGDIDAFRGEIDLQLPLKNSSYMTLKSYIYYSERGLPGAVVTNSFNHNQRLTDLNLLLHGSIKMSMSERLRSLVNIKYSHDYTHYCDPDYLIEGGLKNSFYEDEWYLSLVNHYTLTDWSYVSLSLDGAINSLDANLYRFSYPTRFTGWGALSLSVERSRFMAQLNLLGTYVHEKVKEGVAANDRKLFCPVLSLSFQPFESEGFRVRTFYKKSFRMPTFNDLYYTFFGKSSLRPEFTEQYDLGVTWRINRDGVLSSVAIQTDGYYNLVKDKIVAVPAANLFRWTMLNLDKVEVKGVDLNMEIAIEPGNNLKFLTAVNYTWQRAIDITKGGSTYGNKIPYAPLHSGSVIFTGQWREWYLTYSFLYTGERYNSKDNYDKTRMEPWHTSDVVLGCDFRVNGYKMRCGIEVNNLFNRRYDVVQNFPMPGTSFRVNCLFNF